LTKSSAIAYCPAPSSPCLFPPRRFEQRRSGLASMRDRFPRLALILHTHATFIQFASVGGTGLAVDQATLFLFSSWLPPEIARLAAIWISLSWTFLGNRWLTFAAQRSDNPLAEYLRFCGGCSVGSAVNWGVSVGVWSLCPAVWGVHSAGAMLGSLAGLGFNFTLSRRWVFRGRMPESLAQAVPDTVAAQRKAA
jgi:putative flippase GtrA